MLIVITCNWALLKLYSYESEYSYYYYLGELIIVNVLTIDHYTQRAKTNQCILMIFQKIHNKKIISSNNRKKTQSQYTNAAWTTNDRGIFDKESQHV